MKISLKTKTIFLLAVFCLLFVTAEDADAAKRKISIGSGVSTGGWFSIGGGMANGITRYSEHFEATCEGSAAALENFRNLAAGNVELAMSQPDTAWDYYMGINNYAGAGNPNLRALWSMFTSVNHTIVLGESPYRNIQDLIGKKIAVGAPASGNEVVARRYLEAQGITYDKIDEQFISSAQMMTALKDGQIDAIKPTFNVPNGTITDLALSRSIRFIGSTPEEMERFLSTNKGYFAYTLKAGTYKGQDEDVLDPGFRGIVFTDRTLFTDDEVYEIVKAVWESRDECWKDIHVQCSEITLDQEFQGWPVPLHMGAYRYYKEKGLDIPEHLIPPEAK